jgi:putative ABC transport system substrate-binding protein
VRALQRATTTLPIVFANVGDPVGSGVVASLAQPGGNATGFLNVEYGMSGKWLELLKQIAPRVTRVAVIRDPTGGSGLGQFGAIMGAAPTFGVEVSPIDARDARGIEHAAVAFSRAPNGGLLSFLIRPANQPAASLEIVFCGFMVMWSLSFQGWDPEDLRTCLKGYFLTLTSKP